MATVPIDVSRHGSWGHVAPEASDLPLRRGGLALGSSRPHPFSMTPDHSSDPFQRAVSWLEEGLDVAVATVVATWGSSPRRPGSVMCMNERGDFAGSVSGGCVETAVVEEARGVLESGRPGMLEYGVTNGDAWEVGLACGGTVQVWVEPVHDLVELGRVVASPERGPSRIVATDLSSGDKFEFFVDAGEDGNVTVAPDDVEYHWDAAEFAAILDDARDALNRDRSRIVQVGEAGVFLHVLGSPVRVVIVGAVHIAQNLVAMVRAAGFAPVVVDPRTAFATPVRFPDVELVHAWPAEAFRLLDLDDRTAVVALTHDPKLDDPALKSALASDAFYIGALGSRRTHARRRERLREEGIPLDALDRIRAPIGLDIGARTPGEIATSIMAEVVRDLRTGRG